MTSFYTDEELNELRGQGFRHIGVGCMISRKASFYGQEQIAIGDYVRIDDFCILSGHIEIGSYVNIAAYDALYGGDDGIFIDDFANFAPRVTVFSVCDDYSGETMTNSMIPDEYKNVRSAPVHIGRHVIIGSTSVVLPGVHVNEGGSFGSFSFINHDSEPWSINAGIPFRRIKERSRNLLEIEQRFLSDMNS